METLPTIELLKQRDGKGEIKTYTEKEAREEGSTNRMLQIAGR